jgi:hypothetical protein
MRFIEVVHGRPPNYEAIVAVFPGAALPGVIFAYGDRVYAPGAGGRPRPFVLPPELHAHEAVHLERQAGCPEPWWERYLADTAFRLEEEILAHCAEYRAYCARHPNRVKQAQALAGIAAKLAAPLYGGLISAEDAREAILRV